MSTNKHTTIESETYQKSKMNSIIKGYSSGSNASFPSWFPSAMVFQAILICCSLAYASNILLWPTTLYCLYNGFSSFAMKCYDVKNKAKIMKQPCIIGGILVSLSAAGFWYFGQLTGTSNSQENNSFMGMSFMGCKAGIIGTIGYVMIDAMINNC